MDLSIIIVPFKCKDKFDIALEAVYGSQTSYSYEVIIIDNNSQDGTVEMVRQKYLSRPDIADKTTFIASPTNDGFPIANNRGMRLAKGDYILLLNPDTKVASDNIQVMIDFIKTRSDVGITTCKLIKTDGSIDPASRRSEPDPKVAFYRLSGLQFIFPKWFGSYNVLNTDISQQSELGACSGAYMLFPRHIYSLTRGFDEDFYMYGEDLDLCKRVREAGFKIWYYPYTTCIHYKGQSSKKAPALALYAFHDAMWIYYKKHYQKQYNFLMDAFVYLGVWGRYYWKRLQNAFRKDKFVSR